MKQRIYFGRRLWHLTCKCYGFIQYVTKVGVITLEYFYCRGTRRCFSRILLLRAQNARGTKAVKWRLIFPLTETLEEDLQLCTNPDVFCISFIDLGGIIYFSCALVG